MHVYRIFGGSLRSQLRLPGLAGGRGAGEEPGDEDAATWFLHVNGRSDEAGGSSPDALSDVGEERGATPFRRPRIITNGDRVRLDYGPPGHFRVFPDGTEIEWVSRNGPCPEAVRRDVRRRVLPVALLRRGVLTLHASAVVIGDGTVAFVGAGGFGKSALAGRFAASGAHVVADDLLTLETEDGVRVRGDGDRLRLRADLAHSVGLRDGHPVGGDGRVEIALEREGRGDAPPLSAIYLLTPVPRDPSSPPVDRERLPASAAAAALRSQVPVPRPATDDAGGEPGAPEALIRDRCREAARRVPVYRLDVVRDLERLPEVESELRALHGAGTG